SVGTRTATATIAVSSVTRTPQQSRAVAPPLIPGHPATWHRTLGASARTDAAPVGPVGGPPAA
uniref:Uncharacterized protein n=1 Tax=Petromyzon marinus TaxID=7757 RepID=S4RY08_PETMA